MNAREVKLLEILNQNGPEGNVLPAFYQACLPIIRKTTLNYSNLDVAAGFEDLVNHGFFAVRDTFLYFKSDQGALKITSYLVWRLKKVFTELCPLKDRIVVIYYPEGRTETISYQNFQKMKRRLPPGTEYRVISRMLPFDDLENRGPESQGDGRSR